MIKRRQADGNKGKKNVRNKAATGKTAIEKIAQGKTGGRKLYVLGAAGLVLLLLFSFFVPQLIFSLRDSYLCRDIVHEEQEGADVTILRAAYEPSLGQRLKNFVEGQERGRNFFVSVQEMEVTEELYQQLRGVNGILYQQDILTAMMEIGMVSYIFLNEINVNCWKQYVIYSDEYTEGVNFIIWYLELEADGGRQLELLVDAEDATLYALCTKRNKLVTAATATRWEINDLIEIVNLGELWYFLNYYYQSISRENWNYDLINQSKSNNAKIQPETDSANDGTVTMEMLESALAAGEAISLPDDNTIILHLLFSRQNLDFSCRVLWDKDENDIPDYYPKLYMGIDSISGLIPEFAERF